MNDDVDEQWALKETETVDMNLQKRDAKKGR